MTAATATDSMSIVNLAARQRMLSQRMILQTVLAASGENGKLQAAQTSFQLFCESQKVLVESTSADEASARLIRDTYNGPRGVGAIIEQFMRQMRTTLQYIETGAASLAQGALDTLVASTDTVLEALNTATTTFDRITRGKAELLMKELTSIVSDIQTVAREAKMVSFNAQIMAARAGEHGREFSVVANVLSGITGEIDGLSRKAMDLAVRNQATA
ncbi:methyl-accepting chemotaxis protein [Polaromonas sp. UC242_47]|uniref:methyl-accepting chemotaxis protein n=1 Tax=Polaromonas sp. UC242_47 TaxID=3374626 RepID=UPI0037A82811